MAEHADEQRGSSRRLQPTLGIGTLKRSIVEKQQRESHPRRTSHDQLPLDLSTGKGSCTTRIASSPEPQNEKEYLKPPGTPHAPLSHSWHQPRGTAAEMYPQLSRSTCADNPCVYVNPYYLHPFPYVPRVQSALSYPVGPPSSSFRSSPPENRLALLPSSVPCMDNVLLYESLIGRRMGEGRKGLSLQGPNSQVVEVTSSRCSTSSAVSVDENEAVDIERVGGSVSPAFDDRQPPASVATSSALLSSLLAKPPERSEQPNVGNRKRGRPVPEEEKTDAYRLKRKKNNAAAKKSRDKKRQRDQETVRQNQLLMMANERLNMRLQLAYNEALSTRYGAAGDAPRSPFL